MPKQPMKLAATLNLIRKSLPNKILVQVGFLLLTMTASGLAEILSLGAIVPFLQAISNIDKLKETISQFASLSVLSNLGNDQLVLVTSFCFILAIGASSGIRLLNLHLSSITAAQISHVLSNRVFKAILSRQYAEHINSHSSTDINLLTSHIKSTSDAILSFLQLTTASLASMLLLIAIAYTSLPIAFFTASCIIFFYAMLAKSSKKKLVNNGIVNTTSLNQQVKTIQESLGSFRDVVIDNAYEYFQEKFSKYDWRIRKSAASSYYIKTSPRFIIEPAAFIAIVTACTYLTISTKESNDILFTLGVIAVGLQKLIPSLQQIYNNWASLKNAKASVDIVCQALSNSSSSLVCTQSLDESSEPIERVTLELCNVSFCYKGSTSKSLKDVSITLRDGEIVGIIGTTGSGKSTLLDILMGLLEPTSGSVNVNGANLHDKRNSALATSWRSSIAHVPQEIHLTDASVEENIAFGLPLNEIDNQRVKWSASQAAIHHFIESLPMTYATTLGERGSQLSGGQKQRVGIARAFYKDSSVLFFDEATSALDSETEERIISSIKDAQKFSLVLMIAHRLGSLKNCTRIIELKDGRITKDGPPETIFETNKP